MDRHRHEIVTGLGRRRVDPKFLDLVAALHRDIKPIADNGHLLWKGAHDALKIGRELALDVTVSGLGRVGRITHPRAMGFVAIGDQQVFETALGDLLGNIQGTDVDEHQVVLDVAELDLKSAVHRIEGTKDGLLIARQPLHRRRIPPQREMSPNVGSIP